MPQGMNGQPVPPGADNQPDQQGAGSQPDPQGINAQMAQPGMNSQFVQQGMNNPYGNPQLVNSSPMNSMYSYSVPMPASRNMNSMSMNSGYLNGGGARAMGLSVGQVTHPRFEASSDADDIDDDILSSKMKNLLGDD